MIKRLIPFGPAPIGGDEQEPAIEEHAEDGTIPVADDDLDIAIVAEDLLSEPEAVPETDNINNTEEVNTED